MYVDEYTFVSNDVSTCYGFEISNRDKCIRMHSFYFGNYPKAGIDFAKAIRIEFIFKSSLRRKS